MDNHGKILNSHILFKTSLDVMRIRRPCTIVQDLLFSLNSIIKPGVKTIDIDNYANEFISGRKGISALKGYKGFPGNVCISVNNVAAHGIGNDYVLQNGDIVTVDSTVGVDGWYGDAAWTYIAGESAPEKKRLIKASWKAMLAGIAEAVPGRTLGDIGFAISRTAARYGCSIIDDLAGHGIGRDIHEDPVILNFGTKRSGLPVVPGMVFTIEPILTLGKGDIRVHADNWSLVTEDNNLTAQFECTLAVFSNRTDILTLNSINLEKYIDFPPMF